METTPIINILYSDLSFDTSEMVLVDLLIGSPKVQAFKNKLGRQNYCFQGEYRYWVWESVYWKVYVSNSKGQTLEVPEDFNINQAKLSWENFKKSLKITAKDIADLRKKMNWKSHK